MEVHTRLQLRHNTVRLAHLQRRAAQWWGAVCCVGANGVASYYGHRAAHCGAQVHGKYSVLTNGRVLAEGRQSLLFTKPEGGAISLELLGRKAVIRIMANKMLLKFHYSCVVDGSAAPEPLAVGCMPCHAVPSHAVRVSRC